MILTNCTILTGNISEVIQNGAIYIKDNKIVSVDLNEKILEKHSEHDTDIRDMEGKILIPGLSNPFSNFYINELNFFDKIVGSNLPPYEKFSKIINHIKNISDNEFIFERVVKLASFKSLINGVTSVIVTLPFSENLKYLKEFSDSLGIKLKASPMILVENGFSNEIKENLLNNPNIYSITLLGAWGLETSDYEFLKEFMSKGKRVKVIIIDFNLEDRYSRLKHGRNLLDVFKENNFLSRNVDIVFAGNITSTYMDQLASKGTRFIKSIRTELTEIGNTPKLIDMMGRGIKVSIGTSFSDYSLFDEAKFLITFEKFNNKIKPELLNSEVERTIFLNNYSVTSEEFGLQMGKIHPGYDADISILNCRTGDILIDSKNPFTQLASKISNEIEIFGVMVSGEFVVWDRKPKKIDIRVIKRLQKEINEEILKIDI